MIKYNSKIKIILKTYLFQESNNYDSFLDDERMKLTLIRLEVEKCKILEQELEKKEERKRRELEEVKIYFQ